MIWVLATREYHEKGMFWDVAALGDSQVCLLVQVLLGKCGRISVREVTLIWTSLPEASPSFVKLYLSVQALTATVSHWLS